MFVANCSSNICGRVALHRQIKSMYIETLQTGQGPVCTILSILILDRCSRSWMKVQICCASSSQKSTLIMTQRFPWRSKFNKFTPVHFLNSLLSIRTFGLLVLDELGRVGFSLDLNVLHHTSGSNNAQTSPFVTKTNEMFANRQLLGTIVISILGLFN